ncbi:hypothetical protein RYA05_02325 [Pseudomonas syringae pv. actinidiae]|nr:hypothetical protein [Pseudomonas syringae pv. actinidiae]
MIEKQKMFDLIREEVKFSMYSALIAKKLHELGCDNVAWSRDDFRSAITEYPMGLSMEASFLIGKYEGAHNKHLCDVYFDILRDSCTHDNPMRRESFAHALVEPHHPTQIDVNPSDELAHFHSLMEQPTLGFEAQFLHEPYVFPYDYDYESSYEVSQKDLMQFRDFDIDSLSHDKKEIFFSLPLDGKTLSHALFREAMQRENTKDFVTLSHESQVGTILHLVPREQGQKNDKSLNVGVVAGIAIGSIEHVNHEDRNDRSVRIARMPHKIIENEAAMCVGARVFGSYSLHSAEGVIDHEELDKLAATYEVQTARSTMSHRQVAHGRAIFDAVVGKSDPYGLVINDDGKPWTINPDVLTSDLKVAAPKGPTHASTLMM